VSAAAREHDADGALAPYRAVHAHAERELELAGRGDVDGLVALGESWEELIAGLPTRPPLAAASLLERAQLIHERTRIELIRLRDALMAEFTTSTRASRTVHGYRGQVPRRPRLDRSA
jgi:hypothetical protein